MEFGDRLGISGRGGFEGFLERHGVSARSVLLAAKGAQTASRDADIGRINMPVDVEIRFVAVHALAHMVGHPAHGENIAGAVECKGICRVETITGQDFGLDRLKARVVRLESVRGKSVWRRHSLNHTAGEWLKPWDQRTD